MNIHIFSYPGSAVLVTVIIFFLVCFLVRAKKFQTVEKKGFINTELSQAYLAFLYVFEAQDRYQKKWLSCWKWYFLPKYRRVSEHCCQQVLMELARQSCYSRDYTNFGCLKNCVSILFQWEKMLHQRFSATQLKVPSQLYEFNEENQNRLNSLHAIISEKMYTLFDIESLERLKQKDIRSFNIFFEDQRRFANTYGGYDGVVRELTSFEVYFLQAHRDRFQAAVKNEVHRLKDPKIKDQDIYVTYCKLLSLDIFRTNFIYEYHVRESRKLLLKERDEVISRILVDEKDPEKYELLLIQVSDATLKAALKEKLQKKVA